MCHIKSEERSRLPQCTHSHTYAHSRRNRSCTGLSMLNQIALQRGGLPNPCFHHRRFFLLLHLLILSLSLHLLIRIVFLFSLEKAQRRICVRVYTNTMPNQFFSLKIFLLFPSRKCVCIFFLKLSNWIERCWNRFFMSLTFPSRTRSFLFLSVFFLWWAHHPKKHLSAMY